MDEKRLLNEMGKISCFLKPDSSVEIFRKRRKKEKKKERFLDFDEYA